MFALVLASVVYIKSLIFLMRLWPSSCSVLSLCLNHFHLSLVLYHSTVKFLRKPCCYSVEACGGVSAGAVCSCKSLLYNYDDMLLCFLGNKSRRSLTHRYFTRYKSLIPLPMFSSVLLFSDGSQTPSVLPGHRPTPGRDSRSP